MLLNFGLGSLWGIATEWEGNDLQGSGNFHIENERVMTRFWFWLCLRFCARSLSSGMQELLSLYTSIPGDIWLWVGVSWASSTLVVPLIALPHSVTTQWLSKSVRPNIRSKCRLLRCLCTVQILDSNTRMYRPICNARCEDPPLQDPPLQDSGFRTQDLGLTF